MAYDKLVDSAQLNSDLEDVADAIRAKSGGSSQLAFPSGFVSEIGNISSGGGDSDIQLISEFDFTVPEQTSAAQTIIIPFSTSTLDYYQGNVPFLVYLKSKTEPETPTLRTLVERWELFSLHNNHANYVNSRGFWARFVGTDGTYEYTTVPYGDIHTAGQLLTMICIHNNNGIGIQLKASATQGTVQTGTWHGKLYRISGFVV